jgi:GTPase
MFIDETTITVHAGSGGNGCYAHERERFRPKGKPSGGDGGRGGHVYIMGTGQMHTLQDASYRKTYRAERGVHGKGSTWTGSDGEDIVIQVPLGTIVADAETGQVLVDCVEEGQRIIVAKGGAGGRGNASLVSPRNRNPIRALPGKDGEVKKLHLTLKVLADVGLVGRPNAGKSTFLASVSRARPKIAAYPFTTTEPHLGIVRPDGTGKSFVMADIPGLIEDSHKGKGLGIRFLRHIERTRVLAILVESLSEDPKKDAEVLLRELEGYSPALAQKPHCFILTKADLSPSAVPENLPEGWLWMSAVTGANVDVVLRALGGLCAADSDG